MVIKGRGTTSNMQGVVEHQPIEIWYVNEDLSMDHVAQEEFYAKQTITQSLPFKSSFALNMYR